MVMGSERVWNEWIINEFWEIVVFNDWVEEDELVKIIERKM